MSHPGDAGAFVRPSDSPRARICGGLVWPGRCPPEPWTRAFAAPGRLQAVRIARMVAHRVSEALSVDPFTGQPQRFPPRRVATTKDGRGSPKADAAGGRLGPAHGCGGTRAPPRPIESMHLDWLGPGCSTAQRRAALSTTQDPDHDGRMRLAIPDSAGGQLQPAGRGDGAGAPPKRAESMWLESRLFGRVPRLESAAQVSSSACIFFGSD